MSIFEMKNYRLTVPDGWKAFKVNDRIVQICKGGEKDSDILSKPYMQINFSGDSYMLPPSKDGYYDISDLSPMKLGRYVWQGFSCESMGSHVAMLWTGEGKRQFQMSANLETPSCSIDVEDKDVQSILASITTIDFDAMTGIIPPHILNNPPIAMGMPQEASVDAPKTENCCRMCGAEFASTDAKFCQNCGAEREAK